MASTIKQRLRRFNGTDYDTVHLETEESQVIADYSKYAPSGHGWGRDDAPMLNGTTHDVDFNDLRTTGTYQVFNGNINTPNGSSSFTGWVLVINSGLFLANWCHQFCFDSIGAIYNRYKGSDTPVFGSWRKLKSDVWE